MQLRFSTLDWIFVLAYFLLLIWLSWRKFGREQQGEENEVQFLLSGRKMTLPAFVATLVSTWYGGILGVGEYSYQFGISQWIVLGMPYYLFSMLFAFLLAGKIRLNRAMSIPEAITNRYGKRAGRWSSLPIFILVSPAPYILMLGLLFQFMTGGSGPFLVYAILIALFSVVYVMIGGFGAVIRTDIFQMILMFAGFILLFFFAWQTFGPIPELWQSVPGDFRQITGGHKWQYILVWFFIALWTFVDPGFHQRAAAAKSPATARNGILVSILFWGFFDFLTAFCGMYGWAILGPDLAEPAMVYPLLGEALLPAGFKSLFFLALLATIMSTLDSFLFLSGQTLGRDFLSHLYPTTNRNRLTRIGIVLSAVIAILLILVYPSVIDLWYILGSVFIPGLLLPVLGVYIEIFRVSRRRVYLSLAGCTLLSLIWLILGTVTRTGDAGYAFLGIEPFYPGFILAVLCWLVELRTQKNRVKRCRL